MSELPTPTTDTPAPPHVPNGAHATPIEPPKEAAKEAAPQDAPKEAPKEAPRVAKPQHPTSPKATATTPPKASKPTAQTAKPLPSAPPAAPPAAIAPSVGMRLRMKIWTDPSTQKRYLVPTALVPKPRENPKGLLTVYAVSDEDEDTKTLKLTRLEWNALPFFYFQEDGPAPRAPDVVR